jgi:hypothetical protein
VGDTLWHFQSFLQCINYIILEFTPSTTPLYSPSPIHGIVSTGAIFAFAYICTHFLHHIHPPTPFSWHLPPPMGDSPPPRQVLFRPPVLQFCRREKIFKKMTFLFVWDKGSLYEEFLFDISMYICIVTPIGLYSLSTFYFSPFLLVVSATLRFLYSFLYREYITHIQVLSLG